MASSKFLSFSFCLVMTLVGCSPKDDDNPQTPETPDFAFAPSDSVEERIWRIIYTGT